MKVGQIANMIAPWNACPNCAKKTTLLTNEPGNLLKTQNRSQALPNHMPLPKLAVNVIPRPSVKHP